MSRIIFKPLRAAGGNTTALNGEMFVRTNDNHIMYRTSGGDIDLSENGYMKVRQGGVDGNFLNRNGQLLTNQNFRNLTGAGVSGAYKYTTNKSDFKELQNVSGVLEITGSPQVIFGDEFIPIDSNKTYRISLQARTKSIASGLNKMFIGLAPYDADFNFMDSTTVMRWPGTDDVLAQDLKPGDTKIYLQNSTAGWRADLGGSNTPYYRGINIYGYRSVSGRVYDNYDYTREYYHGLWDYTPTADRATVINDAEKSIKLKNAWTGRTIPAGTKIAQANSSGTFDYCLAGYNTLEREWTHLEVMKGFFSAGQSSPVSGSGHMPQHWLKACTYARPLLLVNYGYHYGAGSIDCVTQVTDFCIEEMPYGRVLDKTYLPQHGVVDGSSYFLEYDVGSMMFNYQSGKMMVYTGSAAGYRGWVNMDGTAIT